MIKDYHYKGFTYDKLIHSPSCSCLHNTRSVFIEPIFTKVFFLRCLDFFMGT